MDPSGLSFLRSLPILDKELLNASELAHVVGHECERMSASGGCNQRVVRADRRSRRGQLGTNDAVVLCASVIEGNGWEGCQKAFQKRYVRLSSTTVSCAIEELSPDNRRDTNLVGLMLTQMLDQLLGVGVEKSNAGIGVEQVTNHSASRSSCVP